jgi:glycolate oxidase
MWKEDVILCELIDSNAFSFLKKEDRPNKGKDAIFFEIKSHAYEKFYEEYILALDIDQEEVFELNQSKFHTLRASIPRAVFEENSHMGVTKMGTDVQVEVKDFPKLLDIYRDFSKLGIRYNLFGHFGDAHLHFNFMPKPGQTEKCQEEFQKLYELVLKWGGSPFAEHGIGMIKQKFIAPFHQQVQTDTFRYLKNKYDPEKQFFPQGFLNK